MLYVDPEHKIKIFHFVFKFTFSKQKFLNIREARLNLVNVHFRGGFIVSYVYSHEKRYIDGSRGVYRSLDWGSHQSIRLDKL